MTIASSLQGELSHFSSFDKKGLLRNSTKEKNLCSITGDPMRDRPVHFIINFDFPCWRLSLTCVVF